MAQSLDADTVLRLRMRSQRLSGSRTQDVLGVVRSVAALQAQDTRAARLAVRPRSTGLDEAAVTLACNEERSVVRTWLMRGTLHMVAAEDVGWLVALLGPGNADGDRRRRMQLGLDEDLCARALPAIRDILGAEGALTRAELVSRLAEAGVHVEPKSQAPAHLVSYAAARGLICRGPDRDDDEPTYVLLDNWAGQQPARDPEDALAELARRYIGAYGPASADDCAAWAGIALGKARLGLQRIRDELVEVRIGDELAWMLAGSEQHDAEANQPCIRLLPAFDAYLLGYRSRALSLASQFARRIQAGGGWIHPALIVDGRVMGTWRQRRAGNRVTVVVEPFEPLHPAWLPALAEEAADAGRFLGVPATLEVVE